MKPVRSAAHAMLASIFVISGVRVLLNPDSKAATASRVTDKVGPQLKKIHPRLPSDARTLTRLKAGTDVAAGLLLATGHATRPAAFVLAANLVPTTLAGHPFWAQSKPEREAQQVQFLKNLGLFGGLLLAAVDTQGRPSLGYRLQRSPRRVQRAVHTAKREAKIAALAHGLGRK